MGHWFVERDIGSAERVIGSAERDIGLAKGTLARRNGTLGCGIESFASHSKNYDETSTTFHVCEEAM